MEIKKGYGPAIILGLLLLAGVVYAATHSPCAAPGAVAGTHPQPCYSANANGASDPDKAKVQEYSANFCVKNGKDLDIFIPTKTTGEWSVFTAAATNNSSLLLTLDTLNGDGTCGQQSSQCQSFSASSIGVGNTKSIAGQHVRTNIASSVPSEWRWAAEFMTYDITSNNPQHPPPNGTYWRPTAPYSKSGSYAVAGSYLINWTTSRPNGPNGNYQIDINFSYNVDPNNPNNSSCLQCPDGYYNSGGQCLEQPENGEDSACSCDGQGIHICYGGNQCHDYHGHYDCVAWGCP